jgi:hypothetical protein
MCVERDPPGKPCPECGQRDMMTFHLDRSVRSITRHKCTRPIPGPPTPPILFPVGVQAVDPTYHASFDRSS